MEKKTRKSGRLSNPYYDTTQFYETIYDKKTLPPEDKKKLQCPSCENKYSRVIVYCSFEMVVGFLEHILETTRELFKHVRHP